VSCFHPLPAFLDKGAVKVGHGPGRASSREPGLASSQASMELPCGHCVGCQMDRSRSWSIRMMHEAQLWDSNLFVTLDYAPEKLKCAGLEYRDFQLFLKKLRKEVPGVSKAPNGKRPVRFFVAGEYGEKYGRPHWHAILFNANFADKDRLHNGTYRSAHADRLWGNGFVHIGDLTPASAAYVAGYTLSKVYGRGAQSHYVDRSTGEVKRPEFCVMSRRPGIGAWWYERYARDLFPRDHAVMDGKEYKVPSYYWRRFQVEADGITVEELQQVRYLRARERPIEESSDARRAVREEVARARLRTFSDRKH